MYQFYSYPCVYTIAHNLLGRNAEYLNLLVSFTRDVVNARNFLAVFPQPLKPFAANMTADINRRIREGIPFLEPLVKERLYLMNKLGENWSDKPVSLIAAVPGETSLTAPAERHASMDYRRGGCAQAVD